LRPIFFNDHLILALILVALLYSIFSDIIYPRSIISTSDNEGSDDEENRDDAEGEETGDDSEGDLSELDLIEICCSWSEQISDGVLEYSINDDAGDAEKRGAVLSAITEWNSVINGLQLVNGPANEGSESGVDIEIAFGKIDQDSNNGNDFSPGEYAPGGETQIDVDEKGFINHIKISISESIFGHEISVSELEQIAKHEIGHALGLGHANFDNNLMSVATDIGTGEISGCEVYGVLAANQWKLINHKVQPEYPAGRYVVC
jgi:hypothetical protein